MESNTTQEKIEIFKEGEKILLEKAQVVSNISSPETQKIISNLIMIMKQTGAMGFAAPQIGIPLRIFIFSSYPHVNHENAPNIEPTVVINPVIHSTSITEATWEKCYSLTGKRGLIERYKEITVAYNIQNGERLENIELTGFPAQLFQHEFDHLEGILYTSRNPIETISDEEYKKRFKI